MSAAVAMAVAFTINIATQKVVALNDLWKHVPERRNGRRLHRSTGYRWKDGVKAEDGSLVKLPTIRIAGTLCTSVEAFQWFCERLSADSQPAGTPTTSTRAAERAGRQCEAMGA